MKTIFLDHCVPRLLRKLLAENIVVTAKYMHWHQLADDDLLQRASQRYDIIITCDKGMSEHRPNGANIAMILLSPCDRQLIKVQISKIIDTIDHIQAGEFVIVKFDTL